MGNETSFCGCHQGDGLDEEEALAAAAAAFEKTPVKKPSLCCQCEDEEPVAIHKDFPVESRTARDHAFLKDFANTMKVGVDLGGTRLRIIKCDVLFLEPLCYVQDIRSVEATTDVQLRIAATDDRIWTLNSDECDTVELVRNGLNLLIKHERKRRASKRRRSSPLKEVQLNLETSVPDAAAAEST